MPSTDISDFALHVYTADKGMKLTSRNGSNAVKKGTRFSISASESGAPVVKIYNGAECVGVHNIAETTYDKLLANSEVKVKRADKAATNDDDDSDDAEFGDMPLNGKNLLKAIAGGKESYLDFAGIIWLIVTTSKGVMAFAPKGAGIIAYRYAKTLKELKKAISIQASQVNGLRNFNKHVKFSLKTLRAIAELDQEYDDLTEMYGKKLQEIGDKRRAIKLDPCKPTTRRKTPERARTKDDFLTRIVKHVERQRKIKRLLAQEKKKSTNK